MNKILVSPGIPIAIGFCDDSGNPEDGSFEVHFATKEHPDSIIVKETAGLPGSNKGLANEILYEEIFGYDSVQEAKGARPDPTKLMANADKWLLRAGYAPDKNWVQINPLQVVKRLGVLSLAMLDLETGDLGFWKHNQHLEMIRE